MHLVRQPRHRRDRQAGRPVHRRSRWPATRAQVLDEAGVERAHVLGASLGGMIAQELAVAEPERVDRLVLCCTHARRAGDGPDAGGDAAALRRGGDARSPRSRCAASSRTRSATLRPTTLVEELYRLRLANPPDPAGWQAQAAAGLTFAGRRRRDRGADARPHRHRRQRRRPAQRGRARRSGSRARASSGSTAPATSSSGSSPTSSSRS